MDSGIYTLWDDSGHIKSHTCVGTAHRKMCHMSLSHSSAMPDLDLVS